MADFEFRQISASDLPVVLHNERRAYSHPWTEGNFVDCINAGNECWLLEIPDKVIGHVILSFGAGESHLLNVCVNPEYQGHGYGGRLVQHVIERARNRDVGTIFLEVRASNQVAHKLYEKLGFTRIGIRKDYYPAYAGREDALVLSLELV